MNRLSRHIVLTLFLAGVTGCSQQITLAVPDMMCEDGCAAKVRQLLSEHPGVKRVNVDFPKRIAMLSIDKSKFNAEGAVAVLVDHGFEHSRVKTDDSAVTPTALAQPAPSAEPTAGSAPPAAEELR